MSYDFSASNDKIDGSFTSTYDIDGSNALSIACWVKRTAAQWADTSDSRIVTLCAAATGQNSLVCLRTNAADEVRASSFNTIGTLDEDSLSFTDGTYDDTWVLVVGVFASNASREVFIEDSTGGGAQTDTNDIDPLQYISIGNDTDGNFIEAEALVAEVCIWNIALSDTDIDALQTGAGTGPAPNTIQSANVIGYWPLDTDQATHANQGNDAGGDLTVQSDAPFSSDHPTITKAIPTIVHHRRMLGMQ